MQQPNCYQSEKILLGCILLAGDSSVFDSVHSIINEDDFYNTKHNQVFKAIKAVLSKSSTLDEIQLLEEIRKSKWDIEIQDLFELTNSTETTTAAVSAARVISERGRARKLMRANRLAIESIIDGEDSQEVAAKLYTKITEACDVNESSESLSSAAKEFKEKLKSIVDGNYVSSSMPTGIDHLDEKLDEGGIGRGEVMIISAPTSCGKSQLALNIALKAAVRENKAVGIFSFEMPASQLTKRMVQTAAASNLKKIRDGNADEDEIQRSFEATDKILEAPIFTIHTVRDSDDLKAKARSMKRKHKIEVLVVDYLQLIPFDPRMKKNDGIAHISHAIKQLAIELNIPVILLAQVNREGARRDTGLTLYDLKDSGDVENDADIILLMWPSAYGDVEKSKKTDINGTPYIDLKYKIAKNREGERDTTGYFKFLNHIGRFQ